ncbi:MAG: hypothetical protein WAW30_01090 [Patescibacteria group bacterium]
MSHKILNSLVYLKRIIYVFEEYLGCTTSSCIYSNMSRLEYEILPERERYRNFCDFIDFYLCTIVREECTRIVDYLRGFEYILFLSVGDVCPRKDNSEQHQDERSQSKKKSIHSNSYF